MPSHRGELSLYFGKIWPYLRSLTVQSVGLFGFAAFLFGIWQIYQPAALVVGGALLVVWTILKMRG